MVPVWGSGEVDVIGVYVVRPCLTSLGLVESVHGHHSTNQIKQVWCKYCIIKMLNTLRTKAPNLAKPVKTSIQMAHNRSREPQEAQQ